MRLALVMALAACGPVKGNVPNDGAPPDDGPQEPDRELVVESRATPIRAVDVLFVIDDSSSMAGRQTALAANFQNFSNALETIPGGLPDMHLGVISTDMGTKGSGSATPGPSIGSPGNGGCANSGKAGNLTINGATTITGNFISDVKLSDGSRQKNYTDASLAGAFGKITSLGATGCGFEQPLHAMRTALDGNQQNAGFLRADALLAVVFLTDEDDCSVADPAMLGPSSTQFGPLLSFRCTRFGVTCATGGTTPDEMNATGSKDQCTASTAPGAPLDPVAPFHDFLVGLKSDPSQVVVAGIMGPATPVAVTPVVPPTGGPANQTLAHSCTQNVNGVEQPGDPAVRLQTFLDLFPNRNTSTTICQNDYSEALEGTANLIAQSAGTPCISKPLLDVDASATGLQVDCIVEDSLGTNLTVIDECGADATPTCWRLVADAATCPLFDKLRLEVVRDGAVPPATVTRARCRVQ